MNRSKKLAAWGLMAAMLAWAAAAPAQAPRATPSSSDLLTQLLRPLPAMQAGQSATLLPDGRWLLVGGPDADGIPTASAFVVDPRAKQTYRLASQLNYARAGHSATLLPDGKVLVLGGMLVSGAIADAAERFDPASGAFETLSPVSLIPRARHTATLLADGRLLIAGGVDARNVPLYDAELYDALSGEVERFNAKLNSGRLDDLAALVPANTVLLWGGVDANGAPLPGAEIYDPAQLRFVVITADNAAALASVLESAAAPAVIASEPAEGALQVAVEKAISVSFSKRLDVTSLNAQTVVLLGAEGAVEARVTPAERGVLLFVKPVRDLLPDSPYTLFISGAKDGLGRELPFTAIGFRTAALTPGPATSASSSAAELAQTPDPAAAQAQKANAEKPAAKPPAGGADDDDEWVPSGLAFSGEWRTGRSRERARLTLPRRPEVLRAIHGIGGQSSSSSLPADVTAVAGQVLRLNGRPLANVTLSIGKRSVQTDPNGEFLLTDVPAGGQTLVIDGGTAGQAQRRYGRYEYRMNVRVRQVNALPFVIWMTRLDTGNTVRLASPTFGETVVTTPRIPGLELRIPRGKAIRDSSGRIVTEVSITAIPVDQPPFPLPNVPVPVYFTIQPGGAHLENVSGDAAAGARLIYPNFTASAPGARIDFWNYDARERGWYVYGQGSVSADRKQIIPDPGVAIYEFTGAMVGLPGIAPPAGPPPGNCPPPDAPPPVDPCQEPQQPPACPEFDGQGGDPVDCYTGLFLHKRTDLRINDVVPIEIRRVYRQADSAVRSFGIGTMLSYDIYLIGDTDPWTYQELILPDGGRVRYNRTSSGTSYTDAVYRHTSTPTAFHGSTINWNGDGWTVELKDGTSYVFPDGYLQSNFRRAAPIRITDRFGNTVNLVRDFPSGNLTQIISPNGRSISLAYDASNRITQASDHTGRTVTYTYDASGRLSTVTDPANGVEQHTYDANHQMLTVRDKRNNVMVTNVYTNGRVTSQTYADSTTNTFAYTLNGSGQVTQTDITDERGFVRRIAFNANGYPLTVTRALGQPEQQVIQRTVDAATNLMMSKTDALGRVTAYQYDTRGNMTQRTLLHGTGNAVSWTYTYDPVFSRVATVTDPLNHTTTYQYDSLGNLASVSNALNHTTGMTYTTSGQLASVTDPLNHTTSISYVGGVVSSITDPLGRMVTFAADSLGRVTAVTDPLGNSARSSYDALDRVATRTDARGGQVSFGYDANSNLTSFTDARSNVTGFAYDTRNRLITKTDALTQPETYLYDAAGNLKFVTDRKGQVRGFTYDALGRQTQAGFGATSTTTPTYDGTITYTYDGANRVTQIADSVNGTIARQYDARFNTETEQATPQGTVTYTYDAAGRRESMTPSGVTPVAYSYDNANRLTSITQGASTVSIAYDAASRRTVLTLANGITVTYGYDNANQLTSLQYRNASNTLLGDLTYAYDVGGRRTAMGGSFARANLPASLASATYDANNRLTGWGGGTLSYDANGNLLGFQGKTYTWNSRDQLALIGGTVTASFGYDAMGRREGRTVSGASVQFLYDGLNPIQERSSGIPTANILTGLGVDEFLHRSEGANTQHYLVDALGSTLRLTDGSGGKLVDYTYEAYGETSADASSTNAIQYSGRENDDTGLYYYRARYYDPVLKRFISEDPIGLRGGLNLMAYVHGNPISLRDPYGLDAAAGSPPNPGNVVAASMAAGATAGGLTGAAVGLSAGAAHAGGMGVLGGLAVADGVVAGAVAGTVLGASLGVVAGVVIVGGIVYFWPSTPSLPSLSCPLLPPLSPNAVPNGNVPMYY